MIELAQYADLAIDLFKVLVVVRLVNELEHHRLATSLGPGTIH